MIRFNPNITNFFIRDIDSIFRKEINLIFNSLQYVDVVFHFLIFLPIDSANNLTNSSFGYIFLNVHKRLFYFRTLTIPFHIQVSFIHLFSYLQEIYNVKNVFLILFKTLAPVLFFILLKVNLTTLYNSLLCNSLSAIKLELFSLESE